MIGAIAVWLHAVGPYLLAGFALFAAGFAFVMFKGERQKNQRDIEDRLAAIEQLVGELSGDDLTRPPPREVRLEPDRTPRLPGALNPRG